MHLKGKRIIFHVVGWLLFFSLMVGFISQSPWGSNVLSGIFSLHYLIFYFVYLFVFYFNSEFLIPKFYLSKKYSYYFAIILLMFIAVYFISPFDHLLQ